MRTVCRYAFALVCSAATIVVIIALAVLLLPTPITHIMLDRASSAERLGLTTSEVNGLSDTTIVQVVFGTTAVNVIGADGRAFYSSADSMHLGDVRSLLRLVLGLGFLSLIGLLLVAKATKRNRLTVWRSINCGANSLFYAVLIIGVISIAAFQPAFEIFHQVFFPDGNYSFYPTDHMVQLYPISFWQDFAAALGLIALTVAYTVHRIALRHLSARRVCPAQDDSRLRARVFKSRQSAGHSRRRRAGTGRGGCRPW